MHNDIKKCLDVLESGGLILYPTDTIWGIGCDARNTEAVNKIYQLKQRDKSKPMSILLDKAPKLQTYVKEVPEMAWDLIEVSEKPITIVYEDARNISEALIAKDGTIGIRITNEEFTHKLIERFRRPIVSTSANITGENSPSCFSGISEEVKKQVDYIVQFGQKEKAVKSVSSIVKLSANNQVTILRK